MRLQWLEFTFRIDKPHFDCSDFRIVNECPALSPDFHFTSRFRIGSGNLKVGYDAVFPPQQQFNLIITIPNADDRTHVCPHVNDW